MSQAMSDRYSLAAVCQSIHQFCAENSFHHEHNAQGRCVVSWDGKTNQVVVEKHRPQRGVPWGVVLRWNDGEGPLMTFASSPVELWHWLKAGLDYKRMEKLRAEAEKDNKPRK